MSKPKTTEFPRLDDDEEYAAAHANFLRVRQALSDAKRELQEHIDNPPRRMDVDAKADEFVAGGELVVNTLSETTAGHTAKGEELQLKLRALEAAFPKAEENRRRAARAGCLRILAATKGEWNAILKQAGAAFDTLLELEDAAEEHLDRLRAAGVHHLPEQPAAVTQSPLIFSRGSRDVWKQLAENTREALSA